MTANQAIPNFPLTADNRVEQLGGNGLLHQRKYGVKTAAKMIGIGETKLREFIREGEIPVLLIDSKYLLLERDLEAFIRGNYGPIQRSKPYKDEPKLRPLPNNVLDSDLLRKVFSAS
jgi:hypothetical protein